MGNANKKIKIDFDFLDKETPKTKQSNYQETSKNQELTDSSKWNWKAIIIAAIVIVIVIWIGTAEDNNTPAPAPNSPASSHVKSASTVDDRIEYGEYICTQYHYDKAVELSPEEEESTLNITQITMESRGSELERLENEINNSPVNEYSAQWEIDNYNDKVDSYNLRLSIYRRDSAALDSRIDKFNQQVEAHNNYLENNCTPK